jgi:SHS2 domain-containing protein
MPYVELAHTADRCLRVWAADLTRLFIESARGMNSIASVRLVEKPRILHSFSISAPDVESLLVSFLTELLFLSESRQLAFDRFTLKLKPGTDKPCTLSANLEGAKILSMEKAIKAVTFHHMDIHSSRGKVEVEIVFDV